MKIKTSELAGSNLNLAIAMAIGACGQETGGSNLKGCKHWIIPSFGIMRWDDWTPSSDWAQGGPLISLFRIDLITDGDNRVAGYACDEEYQPITDDLYGETHLIAAMRAIVSAKLGCSIELPE